MEVVYYPKYPSWNLTKQPNKMKRRSLMQRLSSWFEDHLPLRRRSDVRRSERGTRQKASKSVAAPRMRYSVTNAQKQNDLVEHHQHQNQQLSSTVSTVAGPPHTMSISMIGKDSIYDDGYTDHHRYNSYIDDMSMSTFSHLGSRHPSTFNDTPLSQSFSSAYSSCRRPRIRTNPWISSSSNNHHRSSSSSHNTTNNTNTSTSMMFRSPQKPSTSLASRSVYSAPDALSSSAAVGVPSKCPQQQQPQTLKPPELLYSSMDRTSQLRVKSLDESTCSSGYGSQDSSPESSVHSPDWQQTGQQQQIRGGEEKISNVEVDKSVTTATAVTGTIMGLRNYHHHPNLRPQHHSHHDDEDEHVYHELESLHRLSLLLEERACSSDGEFMSPQPTHEEKPAEEDSRTSSPIYAIPYDSQRNSLCSENPLLLPQFTSKPFLGAYENPYARIQQQQQQPLSIESPFFQKPTISTSNYAVPFRCPSNAVPSPPQWHCPPPPPIDTNVNGEVDFLAELDKQIAELQIQSDAVRHLVEQAKERQELRERTRILCMEHINELRKMRWFMRNNFELCL